MTYTKTEWVNNAAPDIDDVHLNKIEQGIYDAHLGVVAASDLATSAKSDAASSVATVNGHVGSVSNPHQTTAKQVGARHHKNAIKRGCVANNSFDCTTILQQLLDEIRDAGGGELYLPNDGNSVYRTRGLWVPANCRVVSDGAKVAFYDGGAVRGESPDGDLISALGFWAASQFPARGAAVIGCNKVLIEGMTIDAAASGYQSFTALMPTDPFVQYWEANPWSGDPNRKPSNVYPASSLRGLVPIWLAGDEMTVRDVTMTGTPYDAIQISGNKITLERVTIASSRRNNISVFGGSELEFYKMISSGCLAIIPLARTVNSSWTFREYAPGCGIEIEPFGSAQMQAIRFRDCTMVDNGGAAIGADLNEGGTSSVNGLVIDGCYLAGNGGPSRDDHTIMRGNVWIDGGNGAHAAFITNSTVISARSGCGLELATAGMRVVVSASDLRFNSAGPSAGPWTDGGGNITS